MDTIISNKLLDTTVLIDVLQGIAAAADYLNAERAANPALFVSAISVMELVPFSKCQYARVQRSSFFNWNLDNRWVLVVFH